jgi:PPM family protein phosphatase
MHMHEDNDSAAAFVCPSAWRMAHHSQQGLAHQQAGRPNEDAVACGVSDSGVLSVAVADGVGSGERGDLASALVARHWTTAQAPGDLSQALVLAGKVLVQCEDALVRGLRPVSLTGHGASGSMFVGAWLFPTGDVVLGHVGDCRAYRIHGVDLHLLTRDHTYANLGLPTPPGRRSNDPARMIGGGMMGPPDVQRVRLEPGDWLLLCSDGLHGAMEEALLADCVRQVMLACHPFGGYRESLLTVISRYFVQRAVRVGGKDDVSVAVARFSGPLESLGCRPTASRPEECADSVWPSDIFPGTTS